MVTGTKVGKTIGCAIWLVQQALNHPATKWWWVAPVYRQTKIGFDNMKGLLPPKFYIANKTDLSINLGNGSIIECRSGEKADNLYGEAINGVVVDEASRMREASFDAIRTVLTATKGPVKIISNPKGKNWFYKYFCFGQDPLRENYQSFSLTTYDSPYVDPEVIEDAKSTLPENIFRELYMGEFLEDSAGVFRGVSACIDNDAWSDPLPHQEYAIGVDLAKYQDFTVLCVVDISRQKVVAWDRFNQLDWGTQKRRIMRMSERYHNARVLLDSTGLGDPIYDDLMDRNCNVLGYKFSNTSKRQLIEALVVAIEQKYIRYPDIPELIGELGSFEYSTTLAGNVSYNAPEGMHDDCVTGLALANWILKDNRPGNSDFEIASGSEKSFYGKL